jgi:Fe2+ or Zn2+ uptake regulation protein
MERLTNQKKIILDYLKMVKCHPAAEKVYNEVRKKLPQISLATVYRILDGFKKNGLILELSNCCQKRYDADLSPHAHFICQKCKEVFDIFNISRECSILKNKKVNIGKINNYKIYFYGQCKKCQSKKTKGSKSGK